MLHSPKLLSAIRAEVTDVVASCDSNSESSVECAARLTASCPLLVALYHEVLRLVTSSISVRNVAVDVPIGGKILRKDGRVIIPYRQTLFDQEVFGGDAKEFNVDRFLGNKSLAGNPSYRPFGGGTTYCPGRMLAKAEVITAVAVAVARFDMELVTPSKAHGQGPKLGKSFPRVEMKKPCLGIMGPVDGDDVVVRIRAPVSVL